MCSSEEDLKYFSMYLNLLVPAPDTDTFLTDNLHYLLPPVFHLSAMRSLSKPLVALASLKEKRPKVLINEYFPKIYAYIVVNSDKEGMAACVKYLKKETGTELAVLITSYRWRLVEELLCVMYQNREEKLHLCHVCYKATILHA